MLSHINDAVSVSVDDPVNSHILAIAEDRLEGFHERPFERIAALCGLSLDEVLGRVRVMLEAGVIRRIRQTIHAARLSCGALIAWRLAECELDSAFNWLMNHDPFTGHIVLRRAEYDLPGAEYQLWTTLRVPFGYDLQRHCQLLKLNIKADHYVLLPARAMFALGVGHIRRRGLKPGAKNPESPRPADLSALSLNELEWQVLEILKRELDISELINDFWRLRAARAGMDYGTFLRVVRDLDRRGLLGRFSTFLEHVRGDVARSPVTRYNALFQWSVPEGRELEAGAQISRFLIMTHVYWRAGAGSFAAANLWGMAHGLNRDLLLRHKTAIDLHLENVGLPAMFTNVFWSLRSVVRPSEILSSRYQEWAARHGLND